MGIQRPFYGQIRVGNRSSVPILAVTFDPDGRAISFGYFGVGPGHATAGGGRIPLTHKFQIEWQEGGKPKRSTIDLTGYASKQGQIQSMSFYYLGYGRWQVVAQDGLDPGSRVVSP